MDETAFHEGRRRLAHQLLDVLTTQELTADPPDEAERRGVDLALSAFYDPSIDPAVLAQAALNIIDALLVSSARHQGLDVEVIISDLRTLIDNTGPL